MIVMEPMKIDSFLTLIGLSNFVAQFDAAF